MPDYTGSKPTLGEQLPDNMVASAWKRTEPLLTPVDIREVYLFGIPLVSGMKDPNTKRAIEMKDPTISKFIDKAVSKAELETGLIIFPAQSKEKIPYDKQLYDSYGYMQLQKKPVISVERVTVTLANGDSIYEVPSEWIEVGNATWGQLNILPLSIVLTGSNVTAIPTSAGGALLLSIFQGRGAQWVPSFFEVLYTSGFRDGNVHKSVNELIGTIASMDILSQLAATFGRTSSASLSMDGVSQAVSTPGPEVFTPRMKDLATERAALIKKLKAAFHLKLFSGNV